MKAIIRVIHFTPPVSGLIHLKANQSAFLTIIFIMSRFARISEDVLLRHRELVGENGKPAKETLFLYLLIILNTWSSGICEKTISEICEIYDLEYHNSTRRLKFLRDAGWVENTKKHIRPLIIHQPKDKTVKSTVPENDEKSVNFTVKEADKSVNFTPKNDEKSVNFTPEKCKIYTKNDEKSVNFTPEKCKIYTKNDEKSVDFTPENDETPDSINASGDPSTLLNFKTPLKTTAAANKTTAAAAADKNNFKSIFSLEECLRYAEICLKRGEPIKSLHGLAVKAYQTGNDDVFIRAALYPEQIEETIDKPCEFDDGRFEALEILSDLKTSGEDVASMRQWYSVEVWDWLMKEMGNGTTNNH